MGKEPWYAEYDKTDKPGTEELARKAGDAAAARQADRELDETLDHIKEALEEGREV